MADTIFKINSLIIFDDNIIKEFEYNEIMNKMIDISSKYNIKYDYIFIYIFGFKFIEFNLIDKKVTNVNPKNIIELSLKAIEMVIIEEENSKYLE